QARPSLPESPQHTARPWHLAALLAGLVMLGPFSVDTYLPAFSVMAQSLETSQLRIQQTLTVYLFAFAAMSLWRGALWDALGRKPVIVVSLGVYILASAGCAIAGNVES